MLAIQPRAVHSERMAGVLMIVAAVIRQRKNGHSRLRVFIIVRRV
jgi:hypothetical protein